MAHQEYEYKVISSDLNRSLEENLNEAAADGWRVSHTTRSKAGVALVIMERKLVAEASVH